MAVTGTRTSRSDLLEPGRRWRNWGRVESAEPIYRARPTSVEEVSAVVLRARELGLPVKAIGAGHSFTAIAAAPGVQLDLAGLDGLLDVDAERRRITIGAGTNLYQLPALLAPHGLAMENLGDIDRQTVAGAISTGTHGTGAKLRNISSQVVAMELVLADGSVRRLTAESDPELLRAARVSIGALGAICSVTLRCPPAFTLHRVDSPCPREEVLDSFQQRADEHEHFELFTFPYADSALVLERNRTDGAPRPRGRAAAFLNDVVLENWALEAVSAAGKAMPRAIPSPWRRFGMRSGPRPRWPSKEPSTESSSLT